MNATNNTGGLFATACIALSMIASVPARAQDAADLAKQLANPVASLVSIPFQFNWDQDIGPAREGGRVTLNIQPVIPFSISEHWNLISRTILPVIYQDDVFPGAGDQFGLSDTVQSLFFSPKAPTSHGLIWGVGPVLLLPTGTDDLLGTKKWGAGPTGVVLSQQGPWTVGALANHIWSFAGSDSRPDVNKTFLQPFVSYTTPQAWSFTLTTESTYDWEARAWDVPINAVVGKVVTIGSQLVQFQAGVRYRVEAPESGAHGWGVRLGVVLLFPKR